MKPMELFSPLFLFCKSENRGSTATTDMAFGIVRDYKRGLNGISL